MLNNLNILQHTYLFIYQQPFSIQALLFHARQGNAREVLSSVNKEG